MSAFGKTCRIPILLAILAAVTVKRSETFAAPAAVAHTVSLKNGKTFELLLPPGFEISVAAEGLRRARFMAEAPDGRIFVTDLHAQGDNSLGSIFVLDEFDNQTRKYRRVTPYLQHLRNPNSIAFHVDESGQQWLYIALTDKLERFRFHAVDDSPHSEPEVLATFPDYGMSYLLGGWHLTRTITFGKFENREKLFVSVGSSCDACEEKEEIRGTLSMMDLDGKHQRIIARGLRNAVGLRFVSGVLYATDMGTDHLGDDAPDETMFALGASELSSREAPHYGWPFCYVKDKHAFPDPQYSALPNNVDCAKVPVPFVTFPAHSSPLGFDHFDSASGDIVLRDVFLVALHGSSKRSLGRGYRVVSIANRASNDFITGFLNHAVVNGRPCDILRTGKDSFLLTDDLMA